MGDVTPRCGRAMHRHEDAVCRRPEGHDGDCRPPQVLLNGRRAEDFEQAAIEDGRECELKRDRELLAGLLSEYPRAAEPSSRPVTDLPVLS